MEKTGNYLVALVAIVALVGLVLMFTGGSSTVFEEGDSVTVVDEERNLVGEAFRSGTIGKRNIVVMNKEDKPDTPDDKTPDTDDDSGDDDSKDSDPISDIPTSGPRCIPIPGSPCP